MIFQIKLSQNVYITLTPVNGNERRRGEHPIGAGTVARVVFIAFPLCSSEVNDTFHEINSNIESLLFSHLSPGAGANLGGWARGLRVACSYCWGQGDHGDV